MTRRDAPKPSRRPTMEDVARHAGVSQMTVSRVLGKKGYASEEVARRVHSAATELGYLQNRLAGGLAGTRSRLVGVALPTLRNRVFSDVLSGITHELEQFGVQPVFAVSEYAPSAELRLVQELLTWRPQGLILSGLEHGRALRDTLREGLQEGSLRVAEIMDIDGRVLDHCFGLSHRRVGRVMAEHLLHKGYRRFACIGNQPARDLRARKRRLSFAKTLYEAGATLLIEHLDDRPSSMLHGREATAQVLRDHPDVQAIYYANDDLAAGGLMHCLAHGIPVPGRVALAGFNGLSFLDALPQRITTIRTPRFEIGAAAARHVIGQGDADAGPRHDLGFELIPGETS